MAAQLGVDPDRLFKTLLTVVDGEPTVAIVPVAGRLSLKRLANAVGGKKAVMANPADAERWTGYLTGGISPFGQKRSLPTFVDKTVILFDTVCVSGGRRGLQIEVTPTAFISLLNARVAEITD